MYRYLIVFFLLINFEVFACDVCGAGGSTSLNYGNAFFNKNTLGFGFASLQYEKQSFTDLRNTNPNSTKETQFTSYVYGRTLLKNRWIGSFSIPYIVRKEENKQVANLGIASANVSLGYAFINTLNNEDSLNKIFMSISWGIESATARVDVSDRSPMGYFIQSDFVLRRKSLGLMSNLMARSYLQDNNGFKNGNVISYNLLGIKTISRYKKNIQPGIGIEYQKGFHDKRNNSEIIYSGGSYFGVVGACDLVYERFRIGAKINIPIKSSFTSLTMGNGLNLQFGYFF